MGIPIPLALKESPVGWWVRWPQHKLCNEKEVNDMNSQESAPNIHGAGKKKVAANAGVVSPGLLVYP